MINKDVGQKIKLNKNKFLANNADNTVEHKKGVKMFSTNSTRTFSQIQPEPAAIAMGGIPKIKAASKVSEEKEGEYSSLGAPKK